MITRNGKIARLPRALREELNSRLLDGAQGRELTTWLNSLPETRRMTRELFNGRPVTEQNLPEWRKGGYQEWLRHREALEQVANLAADAHQLREAGGVISDHLACATAARFAQALADWDGTPSRDAMRSINALRGLCETISDMRRGDHSAAKLEMERERLTFIRMGVEKFMQEEFEKWLQRPEVQARFLDENQRQRTVAERIREIFKIRPMTGPNGANGERNDPMFGYAEGI